MASELAMDPTPVGEDWKVMSVPAPNPAVMDDEVRLKWIDDVNLAEAVRLDSVLEVEVTDVQGPREYHDRHGWALKPHCSKLQRRLDEMSNYVKIFDMKINRKKSKIFSTNWTKWFDFIPKLTINGEILEVTNKTRLLGIICNANGKWNDHVDYLVEKARKRLFFIRRLKNLGCAPNILTEMYKVFVRSILEIGVPLWDGAVSNNKMLANKLERVQRQFLRILSPNVDPESIRKDMKLLSLRQRRFDIVKRFSKGMIENPKFSYLFPRNQRRASRNFGKLMHPKWNSLRYRNSSIPYFIRIQNGGIEA